MSIMQYLILNMGAQPSKEGKQSQENLALYFERSMNNSSDIRLPSLHHPSASPQPVQDVTCPSCQRNLGMISPAELTTHIDECIRADNNDAFDRVKGIRDRVARGTESAPPQGQRRQNCGEETTARRFKTIVSRDAYEFRFIVNRPFLEKKEWFYDQLEQFRVSWQRSWVSIQVERENLLNTSFEGIKPLNPHDFHKEFKIHFKNEPAQDAGGVIREWISLFSDALFKPELHLFQKTDSDEVSYELNSIVKGDDHLELFTLVGRIVGKAIFDKCTINCAISRHFYKLLLQFPLDLDDLRSVDPQLYQSLEWMKFNNIDDILFETFSVEEEDIDRKMQIFDLKRNGRDIPVTDANKNEYIRLRSQFRLRGRCEKQFRKFAAGLYSVIPLSILSVFSVEELELLVNGQTVVDIADWKQHTAYNDNFNESHPQVKWFWNIVETIFSDNERSRLLQFATGTSRVPAGGFSMLESNRGKLQKFTLQPLTSLSEGAAPYPRAHTCFNRLDLPIYKTKEEMNEFLRATILSDAVTGFGME